jgi:hypothetical protein
LTIEDISKKGNNGKEEVLELVIELCNKNPQLIVNSTTAILREISGLMEDNRTKVNSIFRKYLLGQNENFGGTPLD